MMLSRPILRRPHAGAALYLHAYAKPQFATDVNMRVGKYFSTVSYQAPNIRRPNYQKVEQSFTVMLNRSTSTSLTYFRDSKYESRQSMFLSNTRYLTLNAKDAQHEADLRNRKLEAHPEIVSMSSGMTPIFGEEPGSTPPHEGNEKNVTGGLASDIRTIRDTFRLADVPREVLYIGMAGLIPYVGTSMSTLYLAWDTNFAHENGYGYLVSPENATYLLQMLEPLQVGYGAVIISFLSAIHWGLEFAGYGGRKSFRRYAIGLVGPVVGWSTLLLPLHEALLGQFAAFTALYFFDASATSAGLAPGWYGTYRFVLTFVVGASVLITLIGRGKIGDRIEHVPKPTEKLQKIRERQRQQLQRERQQSSGKLESSNGGSKGHIEAQGGVRPGDENEPTRMEMKSKSDRVTRPPDEH